MPRGSRTKRRGGLGAAAIACLLPFVLNVPASGRRAPSPPGPFGAFVLVSDGDRVVCREAPVDSSLARRDVNALHVLRRPHAEKTGPGLTIVLPCFNEEGNIADAIRYATAAAERCATGHEIVVVDDGSIDETASVAARLAERDRRVRVVVHTRNRGYGDAVRTGIAAARMPWVLLTDSDLQFDLSELEDFLPLAAHADIVVGWRILRRDPLNRRAYMLDVILAAAWIPYWFLNLNRK